MAYDRSDRGDWRGERFGRGGQRERGGGGGSRYDNDDRGFFDRAGDEVRSWFGDEEAERRRERDEREQARYDRDRESSQRSGSGGSGYARYAGYDEYDRGVGGSYSRSGSSEGGSPYYTGGTWRESSNVSGSQSHDPRYHEWRNRQIAALDRDYDEYRREHQSQFDDHFGNWRQNRQQQRASVGRAREGQEVVGSDGQHVGVVDHVREDRLILTKGDSMAGGRHHSVPCSWVSKVEDKIELNRTSEQARQAWRDEENRGAMFGSDRTTEISPQSTRTLAGSQQKP